MWLLGPQKPFVEWARMSGRVLVRPGPFPAASPVDLQFCFLRGFCFL